MMTGWREIFHEGFLPSLFLSVRRNFFAKYMFVSMLNDNASPDTFSSIEERNVLVNRLTAACLF